MDKTEGVTEGMTNDPEVLMREVLEEAAELDDQEMVMVLAPLQMPKWVLKCAYAANQAMGVPMHATLSIIFNKGVEDVELEVERKIKEDKGSGETTN